MASYTIVKELTRGEDRKVFLIEEDGEAKILKVYSEKRDYPDLVEIDTLSRLRHPNLIPITSIIEEGGVVSITMPYIQGNFTEYVEKATVPELITLFYKIVGTVDFLLDQNILPFDIHQDNIVMRGNEPIIIDAGMYRRVDCRSAVLDNTYSIFP